MRRDVRPFVVLLITGLVVSVPAGAQVPLPPPPRTSDYGQAITVHASPVTAPASDSVPQLDECDAPKVAVGGVYGAGDVRFTVLASGRVDTASIDVVEAQGTSPAGLRSAAARVLSACHFQPARSNGKKVPAHVGQHLAFDAGTHPRSNVGSVGGPAQIIRPGDDTVWQVSDSLEEAPRLLRCETGSVATGRAEADFVVDVTGRVERGTIEVTPDSDRALVRVVTSLIASCRYVPGRMLGIPVRVLVRQSVFFP